MCCAQPWTLCRLLSRTTLWPYSACRKRPKVLYYLATGFSYALSAVSIPGPLQTNILSVTLRFGWRRGIVTIFSPLISDVPIAFLMIVVLGSLPDAALNLIRIGGGFFLWYLAYNAYQQVRAGATFRADSQAQMESVRAVLFKAVMINLLNPGPYIFWGALNGPTLVAALRESFVLALVFLLAFYGTFLGGLGLLVLLFDRLGSISPRVTRRILIFTILLLSFFGGRLIVEGAAGLLTQ